VLLAIASQGILGYSSKLSPSGNLNCRRSQASRSDFWLGLELGWRRVGSSAGHGRAASSPALPGFINGAFNCSKNHTVAIRAQIPTSYSIVNSVTDYSRKSLSSLSLNFFCRSGLARSCPSYQSMYSDIPLRKVFQ